MVVGAAVQPLEIRHTILAAHHGLAIDDDRADLELARRQSAMLGITVCPIEAVAGEQLHPIADPAHHEAIAVVLDFVNPMQPARNGR